MKIFAIIGSAFLTLVLASSVAFAQINWTEHIIDSTFNGAWSVYSIDLDGDNDLDVLGAAIDADEIAWWKNDGGQGFTKLVIANDFNHAISVYALDMDGDGDMDVLGAAGGIGGVNEKIYWWENDGAEDFTEHVISSTFSGAYCVYAIDVDGDDDIDVLGAANGDDKISWWENDGSQNFTEHVIAYNFLYASYVYAIDLDGDADIDVLGTVMYEEVTWWENDGNENFAQHSISDSLFGSSVFATDLDGDNDIDVLATAVIADDVRWFENDGNQNFTQHIIDGDFNGAWNVHATDMDHDGDIDVVGAAWADSAITWWENDGSQNFTEHNITNTFGRARRAFPIDIDRDGDMDIVGAGHTEDAITWWESDLGPPILGFIDGIVKEQDNATPIENVEVLMYDSGNILVGTDTTDAGGEFDFSLYPDTYHATFSKSGYRDTTLTGLDVVADETTMVSIIMYPSGCEYVPGDANGDGSVLGSDVTYSVRYFKGLGPNPPDSCWNDSTSSWLYSGGDANGNCAFTGSDVTFLVAYFKGNNPEILYCPQTPPAGLRTGRPTEDN